MKQLLNEQFRRMQKIAGIITESQLNESRIIDQDFKDLQAQHDILKKVSIFYREKAKKLGVDINLVGDFFQAMEALEAAFAEVDGGIGGGARGDYPQGHHLRAVHQHHRDDPPAPDQEEHQRRHH
jgi:hypothetical protein